MKLHEKIVKLRRAAGISQEEMAGRLNVSRQAVSRWELGTARPDAENILQLSSLFRVTADYLLNDDYESDSDTPIVKESNRILQANLILIAVIAQVSFLNAAMRPFESIDNPAVNLTEMIIKIVPLLASSIWMASNRRHRVSYSLVLCSHSRADCSDADIYFLNKSTVYEPSAYEEKGL